jgi:hypothetical protein
MAVVSSLYVAVAEFLVTEKLGRGAFRIDAEAKPCILVKAGKHHPEVEPVDVLESFC